MKSAPRITEIDVIEFAYELKDVRREPTIGVPIYQPGSTLLRPAHAIRIHTDRGVMDEYVGWAATGVPVHDARLDVVAALHQSAALKHVHHVA